MARFDYHSIEAQERSQLEDATISCDEIRRILQILQDLVKYLEVPQGRKRGGQGRQNPVPECYRLANIINVSSDDYAKLLGRDIPDGAWNGEISKNDAICQLYYAKSIVARLLYKILTSLKNKSEAKGKPDLNILFIYNMPFRAIAKMSCGMVSEDMVDNILSIVNGHFFKGIFGLILNFVKNLSNTAKFNKILKNQTIEKG